jgi:hypothetical protein
MERFRAKDRLAIQRPADLIAQGPVWVAILGMPKISLATFGVSSLFSAPLRPNERSSGTA